MGASSTTDIPHPGNTGFEADAHQRQEQLSQTINAREQAQLDLELGRLERAMTLVEKTQEYQDFMREHAGRKSTPAGLPPPSEPVRPAPTSESASETQREMQAEWDQVSAADKMRWDLEQQINEDVRRVGGWDNLSPALEAIVERKRAKLEQLIKDSGLE